MFKSIVTFLLFLLLSGCHFLKDPELNEEFSLRAGEEIEIEGEQLFIKFVSIPSDNRCYKSLYDWYISRHDCATVGKAKILTLIRKGNREASLGFLVLGNGNKPDITDKIYRKKAFLNYQIRLKKLSLNGKQTTFLVTKNRDVGVSQAEPEKDDSSYFFEFKTEVVEGNEGEKDIFYLNSDRTFLKGNGARQEVLLAELQEIILDIDQIKIFDLKNEYTKEKNCPDSTPGKPTVILSLRLKGREKSIEHYLGCRKNDALYPLELFQIEEKMRKLATERPKLPEKKIEKKIKDLRIRFSVKGCPRNCPDFNVSIGDRGETNLEITTRKNAKQNFRYWINGEQINELIAEIEEANFFRGLKADYMSENKCAKPASDRRKVVISIDLGSSGFETEMKTVMHYLGCNDDKDLPQGLLRIEKKLEEIVRIKGVIFKSQPAKTAFADLNRKFKISIGEETQIRSQGLSIRFVSVLKDNRCQFHLNEICSSTGEAIILLSVRKGNRREEIQLRDLNLSHPADAHRRFESKTFRNYRIHLKDVPNRPAHSNDGPPEKVNEITLFVTRNR